MDKMELVYLKGLAKQFPTIAAASTEIINLEAILNGAYTHPALTDQKLLRLLLKQCVFL